MDIVQATSRKDLYEVRRLFREYETHLNVDLCFQQFESELATLPGKYAPPSGMLLLATDGKMAVGCGALRKIESLGNRTCEMKRLYVCPDARGLGVGKRIALQLIQDAIRLGYTTMALDTLDRLKAAINLYQSLGFVSTQPYYDNPLSDVIYMTLDLRGHKPDN